MFSRFGQNELRDVVPEYVSGVFVEVQFVWSFTLSETPNSTEATDLRT